MPQFIVKGRVKYNGKMYETGAVVEVAEKDVAEFKNHGWEIVKGKKQDEDKKDDEGQAKLTKNSKKELIIAELVKRGIEHDPSQNKETLFALLGE